MQHPALNRKERQHDVTRPETRARPRAKGGAGGHQGPKGTQGQHQGHPRARSEGTRYTNNASNKAVA